MIMDMKKILISRGFQLIEQETSEYFGDYFYTYSNGTFNIRLVSDRSIESIDISNTIHKNQWYDLALVKSLLYDGKKLNNVTTIEEHRCFLEEKLTDIAELFSDRNYPSTKKRLEELRNGRAEQMFPPE